MNAEDIQQPDELLAGRYRVVQKIGSGSFGDVMEAVDEQTSSGEHVAVKIIKNEEVYFDQGVIEVGILSYLNAVQGDRDYNIVRMKNYFIYKGHLCIVYELLSKTLYEVIMGRNFKGLPLSTVRAVGYQILSALVLLKSVGIVHCDLKPENILLQSCESDVSAQKIRVKVIDFGSSCFERQEVPTYLQSRYYRSPEILIGHPPTTSIDLWSFACILVELLTGNPLFAGDNESDQMLKICQILSCVPTNLLNQIQDIPQNANMRVLSIFEQDEATGDFRLKDFPDESSRDTPDDSSTLLDIVMEAAPTHTGHHPSKKTRSRPEESRQEFLEFVDMIKKILVLDPEQRSTIEEILSHPFFSSEVLKEQQRYHLDAETCSVDAGHAPDESDLGHEVLSCCSQDKSRLSSPELAISQVGDRRTSLESATHVK
ncbi:kinase-like domain-containing protein [Polychytrium aggregatum]|uniref:kinase-like domain-containing protein n=1 Tax=Polychytrium aggregatum TaxID=110093 RepID=UPI0022FF0D3C|nr:kinase-like domain-containing protein [Polychytrium aggregatum]KAI9202231.1 kinase-like domain-containing protein [Polychytrium aggregatum]